VQLLLLPGIAIFIDCTPTTSATAAARYRFARWLPAKGHATEEVIVVSTTTNKHNFGLHKAKKTTIYTRRTTKNKQLHATRAIIQIKKQSKN